MSKKTLLLVLILSSPPLWGVGIMLRFVDITLENIQPGDSVNLRVLKNLPLVVLNQGDSPEGIDVAVESVLASGKEMKDGYEPIPDPTWVNFFPSHFHLGPKASASVDVLVSVPNDPKLIGHHYENIVWAHTETKKNATTPAVVFQAGLRTRFRMSIGTMGPASLQKEKALKKLASINANFSIFPDNLFVRDIPVGKQLDIKADRRASFKIINQSDDAVELKVVAAPPDPNIMPQVGYANVPDPKWLDIEPSVIKIPGNAIKEIKLRLTVPDKPEYRNQKYMFLVRTTLSDDSLPLAYNNMLYISTLP